MTKRPSGWLVLCMIALLAGPGHGKLLAEPGAPGEGRGSATAAVGTRLRPFQSFSVNGGYVARGVGLRNRGFGTIRITGVPAGATIEGAYLYWTILGPGPKAHLGKVDGKAIRGTRIGSGPGPCWPAEEKAWSAASFRADVTALFTGDGAYRLSDFESAVRDGSQAQAVVKRPAADGASLVVVYSAPGGAPAQVLIHDGNARTIREELKIVMEGFTVPTPKRRVDTTFIGADGQSSQEFGSTANGVALPTVDWDGTDPQDGPSHPIGNLWDTDTVNITPHVKAGDTRVTLTTRGLYDCLVWVAQVLAVYGDGDGDDDEIPDSVESERWYRAKGGDPDRKDIWVECDYMSGLKPSATVATNAASVFAAAPLPNPNGRDGIALHLAIDDAFAFEDQWGDVTTENGEARTRAALLRRYERSFDGAPFTGEPARTMRQYTHYCAFANAIDSTSISGVSMDSRNGRGGIPGDIFIVSLGRWSPRGGSVEQQTGTFIHELGHNLGLKHGGNDHTNFKPNYLSVMNYFFQEGFVVGSAAAPKRVRVWDYSRFSTNELDENQLSEPRGVVSNHRDAGRYLTAYRCGSSDRFVPFNRAIDWNCDGFIRPARVDADVNNDGRRSNLEHGQNNWAYIVYDGGALGGPVESRTPGYHDPRSELTFERQVEINAALEPAQYVP